MLFRSDVSFVSAGNLRFPACSQNALRSDDIAGRRPARGQNPPDSGTITRERRSLERQRVPGSEATESPRAVRAGRARRFHRLEFAARSAAHGPRADVESVEGFLDPSIPYLNTTPSAVSGFFGGSDADGFLDEVGVAAPEAFGQRLVADV